MSVGPIAAVMRATGMERGGGRRTGGGGEDVVAEEAGEDLAQLGLEVGGGRARPAAEE
jgi:hypothetical protein